MYETTLARYRPYTIEGGLGGLKEGKDHKQKDYNTHNSEDTRRDYIHRGTRRRYNTIQKVTPLRHRDIEGVDAIIDNT
jgi:hypothetical protein